MNEKLIQEIITYIEDNEVRNDAEWGYARELDELIEADAMPEVYSKLKKYQDNMKELGELIYHADQAGADHNDIKEIKDCYDKLK